jgi:hypothetical protein
LSTVERKNSWQLAEAAGLETRPTASSTCSVAQAGRPMACATTSARKFSLAWEKKTRF